MSRFCLYFSLTIVFAFFTATNHAIDEVDIVVNDHGQHVKKSVGGGFTISRKDPAQNFDTIASKSNNIFFPFSLKSLKSPFLSSEIQLDFKWRHGLLKEVCI